MNDYESAGYMGFSVGPGDILGRVIIASFDYKCPRCGQTVKAHKMHAEDECAKWQDRDAYLPLEDK